VLTTDSNSSFTKSDSFEDTNCLQSSVLAAQISSSTRYNFFCTVFSLSLLYNKFSLKCNHKHIQQLTAVYEMCVKVMIKQYNVSAFNHINTHTEA